MSLQNFIDARKAMVVSQLQPSGIGGERLENAFLEVPREMFVPNSLRGVCYLDADIRLENGRTLMAPVVLGKMLQDAALTEKSRVLDIGGATGYAPAILAILSGEVVALDNDEKMLHTARLGWENIDIQNITPVIGNHEDGYMNGGLYDRIFINGAVADAPTRLFEQLAVGGKLYCVLVEDGKPVGQIVAYEKLAQDDGVAKRVLGDAMTPYLRGFEPAEKFKL